MSAPRLRLVEVRPLRRLEDGRGWFLKVLQRRHLDGAAFGEVYLSVGRPGEVRGCHYHEHTTEWFCPAQGRGRLLLASRDGAVQEGVTLDVEHPVSVRVPPGVAHALVAEGDAPFAVLAVADVEYDPEHPDTITLDPSHFRGEGA